MEQTRQSQLKTTSSEVENSYYGVPPIKAPRWGWLIITYFFAGGLAGASFAIATLADLFSKDKALVRAGRYLSLANLLISPILLTLDLGRPDRAHHMFRIVKLRSPMSLGSWALLLLGVISGPLAAMQLIADVTRRDLFQTSRRVLGILGLPVSLFVSGYTGVLLSATNVPLWARNYLLWGPAFVSSAFSTSLAAISILLRVTRSERSETADAIRRAETFAVLAEIGLILTSVARLGELGKPLTKGRWARIFWPGSFGVGMIVPLGLHLSAFRKHHQQSAGRRMLGAVLALAGGFLFRTVVVFAGKESAEDPKYYFEYTRQPNRTRRTR
jgi:formate-dependent nitrite reductase membrane component NrfD